MKMVKKPKKNNKYDTTLAVKGDFVDILRATASHANKMTANKVKKKSNKSK
jgi:hypothetical protein